MGPRVRLPAGSFAPLHRHAEARVIVVVEGDFVEDSFGAEREYRRGDFFLRPPFYAHHNVVGERGTSYRRLRLSPSAIVRYLSRFGWAPADGRFRLGESDLLRLTADGADDLIDDLIPRVTGAARRECRTWPEELATKLSAADGARVDLRREAARRGLAPYALTRAFRRAYGVPPTVYRRQCRLQRAMEALVESGAPLSHVAVDHGFSDQAHLCREMKTETGLTPGEFRRSLTAR